MKQAMKELVLLWPIFPMHAVWKSPIYSSRNMLFINNMLFENKELFFKEMNKQHIEAILNGINLSEDVVYY